MVTKFKPDFSKANPYEGAPPEYIEEIKGTRAYETAVRAGYIGQDVTLPVVEPTEVTPRAVTPPVVTSPVPPEILQEKQRKQAAIAQREREQKTLKEIERIQNIERRISQGEIPREDIPTMQAHVKESILKLPKDSRRVVEKAIKRSLALQSAAKIQAQDFERFYTSVGVNGTYISKADLKELKAGSPEGYDILVTKGYDEYVAWVARQNAIYKRNQAAIRKLKPYTSLEGMVDGSKFLAENPKLRSVLKDAGFANQDIADWQVYNASKGELIRSMDRNVKQSVNARVEIDEAIRMSGLFVKQKSGLYRTKTVNELTPVEKQGVAEVYFGLTKDPLIRKAEQFIPGYYVARNWTTLETKDKVINIGIDVASVLLMVGVFKVAGVLARRASGLTRTSKLATNAGKAGQALNAATKELQVVTKGGVLQVGETAVKVTPQMVNKAANAAELAQRASMKADRLFIEQLQRVNEISTRQLKNLERRSGLRGLSKAIKEVNAAQKDIDKIWKILSNRKYNPNAKTALELARNDDYLFTLNHLKNAQIRLETALGKAGSVLKPRYSYPAKPPVSGQQGVLGKGDKNLFKEIDNFLKGDSPEIGDIEGYLKAQRSGTKEKPGSFWQVQTKVAEKPKVKPFLTSAEKAKLRTAVSKGKPKVFPKKATSKVTVPKVKTGKFGLAPKGKVALGVKVESVPAEDWGRMTYAEIAKRYGVSEKTILDAYSRTLLGSLVSSKVLTVVSASNKRDLKSILKYLNEEYIKAREQGLTSTAINTSLFNKGMNKFENKSFTQAQRKELTKQVVETLIKQKAPIKSPVKEPTPTPKMKIAPVMPLSITKNEKKKREFLDKVEGLIARRRGELNNKSVWLIDYYPYGDKDKMVIMGNPPRGAKPAEGKGSLQASAILIRGKPPSKPLYRDTGAVDDIITADGKSIKIRSVPDEDVRKRKVRIREGSGKIRTIEIGAGIEINKTGQGHIKL